MAAPAQEAPCLCVYDVNSSISRTKIFPRLSELSFSLEGVHTWIFPFGSSFSRLFSHHMNFAPLTQGLFPTVDQWIKEKGRFNSYVNLGQLPWLLRFRWLFSKPNQIANSPKVSVCSDSDSMNRIIGVKVPLKADIKPSFSGHYKRTKEVQAAWRILI